MSQIGIGLPRSESANYESASLAGPGNRLGACMFDVGTLFCLIRRAVPLKSRRRSTQHSRNIRFKLPLAWYKRSARDILRLLEAKPWKQNVPCGTHVRTFQKQYSGTIKCSTWNTRHILHRKVNHSPECALLLKCESHYAASGSGIFQQLKWDALSRLPTRRVASARQRPPST